MANSDSTTDQDEEHTLLHVICDGCGKEDLLTVLKHPRDAQQTRAVANAHHTIAETHADETGHHVEVGETEDDPESVLELARSMAPSVDGVEPADFSEEYV